MGADKKPGKRQTLFMLACKVIGYSLKANENAKVPSTYDLTRERWDAFCAFVSANPDMRKT